MLLSIIIPVYNVEKYIYECIESVSTYKENLIEIILIDDGSTDSSGEICDEYSKKYKNISVIHKKNKGLSSARNVGIDSSKGKYLMFLDSDDYVLIDKLKPIINLLKEKDIDVVMSNFCEVTCNNIHVSGENIFLKEGMVDNSDKLICTLFKWTDGLWPAWKFIVKKDFLMKNDIKFKDGFLHEDVDYTTRIILTMKKFYYYCNPWYCYRIQREGSIMSSKKFKSLKDTTNIIIDLKNVIDKSSWNKDTKNVIFERLSETFYSSLKLYRYANKKQKKEFLINIKNNKYLMTSSKKVKHRIFYFLSKILGLDTTISMYSFKENKK